MNGVLPGVPSACSGPCQASEGLFTVPLAPQALETETFVSHVHGKERQTSPGPGHFPASVHSSAVLKPILTP